MLAGKYLSNDKLNTLSDLSDEQDIKALQQVAKNNHDGAESARQELISMLMNCRSTSCVLLRSTRSSVDGLQKRELHTNNVDTNLVLERD